MSNRTSEANKAVEAAWESEQERILEGKGTRDWTPEQQKDILEKGKAYDLNGKAFEGHHMKSVEAYPKHQGDPQNIQFLSRDEHKAAHNGNYQNATNGHYNPNTDQTEEFDEATYKPSQAENLSNPIAISEETSDSVQQSEPDHDLQVDTALEEDMEQEM